MAQTLQVGTHLLNAAAAYQQGKTSKIKGEAEAAQQFHNARRRLRQGDIEAGRWRAEERTAASNAKVAMVAQGGMVDQEMLSRMRRESELDAVAAMFDARREANTMRSEGRVAAMEGKQAYRASMVKVGTSLLEAGNTYYQSRKSPREKRADERRAAGQKALESGKYGKYNPKAVGFYGTN